MIHDYFNLPFQGLQEVRCPYFNNTRANLRAQLRALVGKGTPQEIVEEARIISIQYQAGFFDKNGVSCPSYKQTGQSANPEDLRRFLIAHHLGIECSGFVTNVLREHFKQTKHLDFLKKMFFVSPWHGIRWLIARLRPVENMSVRRYADDRNTIRLKELTSIAPADVIIMLETGPTNKRNHIILITDVRPEAGSTTVTYVHARAWASEGQFGHGVSRGTITISAPDKSLLEQTWTENGLVNDANETYLEAKKAKRLEIRRVTV